MEIQIDGIPPGTSVFQLKSDLAKLLHNPPFALEQQLDEQRVNFYVDINSASPTPTSESDSTTLTTGYLTLPGVALGKKFLGMFSGRKPHALSSLVFSRSPRSASPWILKRIRENQFIDSQPITTRGARDAEPSSALMLEGVEFGWRTRDEGFSTEWDLLEDCTRIIFDRPALKFDSFGRAIDISFSVLNVQHGEVEYGGIFIYFSSIETVAVESQENAVLLTLYSAPLLFMTPSDGSEIEPRRVIVSGFDDTHKIKAPYIGLSIRLRFNEPQDRDEFCRMAKAAYLPAHIEIDIYPSRLDVFSVEKLQELEAWMRKRTWVMAFQIGVILTNLLAEPSEILGCTDLIKQIETKAGADRAAEILRCWALRLMESTKDTAQNVVESCLRLAMKDVTPERLKLRRHINDPALFDCYHVKVTPSRLIYEGPLNDQTNHVLRKYKGFQNCFVRVHFVDEEQLEYRWPRNVSTTSFHQTRVKSILLNGLTIAGRAMEFLAYSNSSLKERSVWMIRPFRDTSGTIITTAKIIRELGDFSKVRNYPARYGARMSQAFSATEHGKTLEAEEVQFIPDITNMYTSRYGSETESCFTDGIGLISAELSNEIIDKLTSRPGKKKTFRTVPSVFQVRLGGVKGVLLRSNKLQGRVVCIRPSMQKFNGNTLDLEVAQAFHEPFQMYLNNDLIIILETLGVPAENFVAILEKEAKAVKEATESVFSANDLLDLNSLGKSFRVTYVLAHLAGQLGLGFPADDNLSSGILDRFLHTSLRAAVVHILRAMKYKNRIPLRDSYTLVGVVDHHGQLKEGEVYICVRKSHDTEPIYLEGKLLISRPPQKHTGDIQFVHAIGKPEPGTPLEQENWENCVVFSSRGGRSLPSQLSGGDLDGDLYNVIQEPSLFPPECDTPAEYPAATLNRIDRPCNHQDRVDWVVSFFESDILGLICDRWKYIADQSPLMARDPLCVQLAEMASQAVDFQKSGTPVSRDAIPPVLRKGAKPDWAVGELGSENARGVYQSERAMGKLYRAVTIEPIGVLLKEARALPEDQPKNRNGRDILNTAMQSLKIHMNNKRRDDPITNRLRGFLRRYDISFNATGVVERRGEMKKLFDGFASELGTICARHSMTDFPLSEVEAFIGTIVMPTSRLNTRKSRIMALGVDTDELVRKTLLHLNSGAEGNGVTPYWKCKDWLAASCAAWMMSVSLGERVFGAKSFGFVALASFFDCIGELVLSAS